jgi:hypothetical protein
MKMPIEELSPEQFAEVFFHYHRALAADFGSSEREPQYWNELPQQERNRLVAAARLTLHEIEGSRRPIKEDRSRYFAKPGTAEWGC